MKILCSCYGLSFYVCFYGDVLLVGCSFSQALFLYMANVSAFVFVICLYGSQSLYNVAMCEIGHDWD